MEEEYVKTNFVKEGMIVDLAIHDESREGNQNIHAYIMTIVKPINEDGTYKTYKSTEEIKAMNNEEIQIIYSNMKNYLSDKRTHINY